MVQLGQALQPIVATMVEEWKQSEGNTKWKFAKLDMEDGASGRWQSMMRIPGTSVMCYHH